MSKTCIKLVIFSVFCISGCFTRAEHFLGHMKASASVETQTNAVKELIKRIVPGRESEFYVTIDSSLGQDDKDVFKINKVGDTIKISATTGVAASTAFHYYLKYFCNCHISFQTTQLNLPKALPEINITKILNDKFRYYQNVCTTSYSFVWWSWKQWEKHIDWIAMNSFNLVLAFQGQEAILQRVYTNFNLTDIEIREHFTGPAFLSWLRMGNMRGWGGGLSAAWHSRSLYLQKKILERMRNLGIIPVLPAFAGHLPRAFKRIFPSVNMSLMDTWNDFNDTYCCPYFLDPTEELFRVIGKMFITAQIAEYGTDHVYNCDSFNEVDPPTDHLSYLSNVSKSIYSAMTDADPDAIWLMQGWIFVHSFFFWTSERAKALLTAVPKGKMIVLDLQSEQFPQYNRLHQYFGQPYIWCMLHNFGGTLGMHGSANIINQEVINARNSPNSTMIGVGLTMEGINQNYVMYDLMTEFAWRTEPTNLTQWFKNYSIRRYGKEEESAIAAWQILKDTVYDFKGIEKIRGQYAVTKTPSLNINTWTWYEYSKLFEAWDYFIIASDDLKNSSSFLYDLVDVTRQVLQISGDIYYNHLITAFKTRNNGDFQDNAIIFQDILKDMELILATNEAFLLGRWIEDARACANNSEEADLLEFNARNQITLWGPNGEIMNYAIKQWSGVVSNFLLPRWTFFIQAMNRTVVDGVRFNQTVIKADMFEEVENPFTLDRSPFPVNGTGDTVEIAKMLHKKYWYKLRKYLDRGVRSSDLDTHKSSSSPHDNYLEPNVIKIR